MQQKKRSSVLRVRIIIFIIAIALMAVVLYVAKWGRNYPMPLGLALAGTLIVAFVICSILYNQTFKKKD